MQGEDLTKEIEQFLSSYSPEVASITWKARSLILEVIPTAIEMLDIPARLIGYGLDRTYKGTICGLALQKSYVNLMFARGTSLPDPERLLEGTGKKARHVKLRKPEDLANPALRTLLEAAVKAM